MCSLVGMTSDGSGFTMNMVPTFLNNLQCTGNEQTLGDCRSDPLGMPLTCTGQAAALMCQQSKWRMNESQLNNPGSTHFWLLTEFQSTNGCGLSRSAWLGAFAL